MPGLKGIRGVPRIRQMRSLLALTLAISLTLVLAPPGAGVTSPHKRSAAGARKSTKRKHRKHRKRKHRKRSGTAPGTPTPRTPTLGAQTAWAPVGSKPLSDSQAAALVTRTPENRPENASANNYVPSDAELKAFHSATDESGRRADDVNPLRTYVTGRPGLSNPSTDDLLQWGAHKWGIPEDIVRAQAVVESWWRQSALGDRTAVQPSWVPQYPPQAQIPGSNDVWQSMGILQVRWSPDGLIHPGTEPLRWKSVAFNIDYYGSIIRYYYDGRCDWCGPGYAPGQDWNSLGGWFNPSPWNNQGAQGYVATLKQRLAERTWATPDFQG
ncbi:MAG TPA: hypothetical protein VHE14_01690 [Solirubrobacteraceae bacterium]|nr:hypothetical protein [Solirubrobacteraceae bacterium]